ncbi:MAG: InlB B-repeat-containing protein [Bacilli bacterium]|nr:InlB B-repeat-containing protein [Bacilli bacterium]
MKTFKKLLIGAISLFALISCSSGSGDGKYTVHFDTNTTMSVSIPKDQSIAANKRCRKPTIFVRQDNPDNYQVSGWFKEKDLTNEWNFKTDLVTKNMTLYAKWSKEFKVTYNMGYEGNIQKNINSAKVFDGFTLTEDKTVAQGYQYLGTFTDEEFTQPFDYSKPVTSNLELYIKRSPTIYLSDDQSLSNGTGYLYENLEPALGSPDDNAVLGDVDTYTTSSGEVCTKVNFGYAPKYGDPFVELILNLDITKSQELKITFKNLGKASRIVVYFTAINDLENSIYSETGQNYHEDFSVPADDIKTQMKEDDPWETVAFDLSSKMKYGYSIWGTAKYLGKIRIQATYKNTSPDDLSNVMLFKSIEGVSKDIEIKDSESITEEWEKTYTDQELQEKSETQTQNNGFIFPKNFLKVTTPGEHDNAEIKNSINGLLIHTDNSIAIKERVDRLNKEAGETLYSTNSVITMTCDGDNEVDLNTYSTFNIKIKNYGYAQKLNVYVENDLGGAYTFDISMSSRSPGFMTYTTNLYGLSGIKSKLKLITLTYNAIGVDNLLCIEDITFGEFKRYDVVGLNFYDKYCLGFAPDTKIDVAFDKSSSATTFTMKGEQTDTEIVSNNAFNITTDGFVGLDLTYILPPGADDLVNTLKVSFYIGSNWTTPLVFNINTSEKSWAPKTMTALFPLNYVTGTVTKVKLSFTGTGRFLIKEIAFKSGENTLPYSKSYESIYSNDKDWIDQQTTQYRYDFVNACSTFVKTQGTYGGFRMYIGYSVAHGKNPPHTCLNIPVDGKKAIKVVYQNKTDSDKLDLGIGLDKTTTGEHDGRGSPYQEYSNTIKTNMQDYEWATLTINIADDVKIVEWLGLYIAKIYCKFYGSSINIRSITIM